MNEKNLWKIVIASLGLALLAALSPTIIYGAPPFPDTWIHLSIAKESVEKHSVRLYSSYNTDWPLINIIIAMVSVVTGLEPLRTSYIILFINALSVVPIILLIYRLSTRNREYRPTTYMMFAAILSFEASYFTLLSSIQKESSVLLLANTVLYIVLSRNPDMSRLLPILIVALAFGHHYYSLYILLFFITVFLYDVLDLLHKNGKVFLNLVSSSQLVLIMASLIFLALYEYYIGSLHLREILGYSFSIQDYVVMFSAFVIIFVIVYRRRNHIVKIRSQFLIFAMILASYYALRSGILLPPIIEGSISLHELLLLSGYILLLLNVLKVKDSDSERALIPGVVLLIYSFLTVQFAGGITLSVKAIRKIIPALILQISRKPDNRILMLTSVLLSFTLIFFLLGYPLVGGPSIYTYGEIQSTRYFADKLIIDSHQLSIVYGSWRFVEMSRYYGINATILSPNTNIGKGLVVVLEGDIKRGFLSTSWYLLFNISSIPHGNDLIYNSKYILVYR